jgi:hypothetical protein
VRAGVSPAFAPAEPVAENGQGSQWVRWIAVAAIAGIIAYLYLRGVE